MRAQQFLHARRSPRPLSSIAAYLLAVTVVAGACRPGRQEADASARRGADSLYRIEGKVLKPDTENHAGILVYCAGTSFLAYSDEQGGYAITNVPEGKDNVYGQHADYRPVMIGEVSLALGFAKPSVPVVLPETTLERKESPAEQAERILCSLMGQALLKGQETAEGIIVRAVGTDFRTVTDPSGAYQLLRLDPGQYTIVFEKAGYQSQRRTAQLFSGDLVFPDVTVLEPERPKQVPRVLSGAVVLLDADSQPMGDYMGVLVYLEGTTLVALPDTSGAFRFEKLEPARYVVTAMAPGFFSRDRAEADLTDAAEVSVTLTLQSLEERTSAPGGLAGRVLRDDPQDGLIGTLVGVVEVGATVVTDAQGGYRFDNLEPGTYTLVAQAEGYFPAALDAISVPEGEMVEVSPVTLEKRRDYPRVLSTTPADGERNVLVREVVPVEIRFSKKMRPESLQAAFSIDPPVAYNLYAGREHPQSDFDRLYVELFGFGGENSLQFNKQYTVTVSTDARDFEDLTLESPHRFRFQTGRASVIATRPPNGAVDVFVDPALYRVAVFVNAPLDPKTVTAERIRIRPFLNERVQLSVINSPGSGWSHIDMFASWRPGVRYSVTLTGGIRTRDGSPISNLPYEFTFTTSAGRALDFTPDQVKPRR